jgi:hypothetical protein
MFSLLHKAGHAATEPHLLAEARRETELSMSLGAGRHDFPRHDAHPALPPRFQVIVVLSEKQLPAYAYQRRRSIIHHDALPRVIVGCKSDRQRVCHAAFQGNRLEKFDVTAVFRQTVAVAEPVRVFLPVKVDGVARALQRGDIAVHGSFGDFQRFSQLGRGKHDAAVQ